jgi:hypothetical protein
MTSANKQRGVAASIALLAWFALGLQLYLTTGSVLNFFSYFTIQSNLLIALCLSWPLLAPASNPGAFFSRLDVQSAIGLYIFIVALVYNTILRGIMPLAGWQLVADTLLHVVNPLLYILYWLFYRPSGTLQWKDGLHWLYFPFIFLVYSLVRGAVTGWYPYPFLHAGNLGYQKVSINVVMMIAVFFVSGLLLIAATRISRNKK